MNSGSQILSRRIMGCFKCVDKCGHWYLFSWLTRAFLNIVFKLYILPKMSQIYQKCSKSTLQKGNLVAKFEDTETYTVAYIQFSKRIHGKLVTHTGFFLYLSLKWKYTACKTLCFPVIFEFSAACPLCLHCSAVKVMSCTEHKQPHCYVC